jgi:hypothetical protein
MRAIKAVGTHAGPRARGASTDSVRTGFCCCCCCCSLFFLLLCHQGFTAQRLHCRAEDYHSNNWKTLAWLSSNSPRHPHLQVLPDRRRAWLETTRGSAEHAAVWCLSRDRQMPKQQRPPLETQEVTFLARRVQCADWLWPSLLSLCARRSLLAAPRARLCSDHQRPHRHSSGSLSN